MNALQDSMTGDKYPYGEKGIREASSATMDAAENLIQELTGQKYDVSSRFEVLDDLVILALEIVTRVNKATDMDDSLKGQRQLSTRVKELIEDLKSFQSKVGNMEELTDEQRALFTEGIADEGIANHTLHSANSAIQTSALESGIKQLVNRHSGGRLSDGEVKLITSDMADFFKILEICLRVVNNTSESVRKLQNIDSSVIQRDEVIEERVQQLLNEI